MIAFLDIEASSLSEHSYPIEVAWVWADGTSESHLIRPQRTWVDWDEDSAKVHSILREDLAVRGSPAPDVARRLHRVLAGCDVYSDAPTADRIWLGVLMLTVNLVPPPLLNIHDSYRSIFAPIVSRLPHSAASGLAQSIVRRAEESVSADGGVRHRALPDARRLRETWLAVKSLAAEAMDGWP